MIPIIQAILAITLPAFVIWKRGRSKPVKYPYIYSVGSFAFCAWGIISELTTIKSRLLAGDIGGIEDTIDAVITVSVILTVITLIANLFSLSAPSETDHR